MFMYDPVVEDTFRFLQAQARQEAYENWRAERVEALMDKGYHRHEAEAAMAKDGKARYEAELRMREDERIQLAAQEREYYLRGGYECR